MAINLPDIKPFDFKQFNNGLTISDGMGDTLPVVLDKLNLNINKTANHLKEKLFANRSYYVSTTGLNTNTGLTSLDPLSNINDALNIIYNKLDLNGYRVTINLADGTYNDFVLIDSIPVGSQGNEYPITITGNVTNPDLVKWTYSNSINNCCVLLKNKARILIKDLAFYNSNIVNTNVSAISSKQSTVGIDNIYFTEYGATNQHILLSESTLFYNTIKVKGTNKYLVNADRSIVLSNGVNATWIFENAILTSLIKLINVSSVILNNITYSGTATGTKYEKDFTSSIIATTYPTGLSLVTETPAVFDCNLTVNNSVNITKLLTVTDNVTFNKNLNVSLNTSLGGNFSVVGSSTLTGALNTNQIFINGGLSTAISVLSTFNGPLKSTNDSEFLTATFKDDVLFESRATFNQDVIMLGSVILPNGVINKANLSASSGTGVIGNNGDVLISDNSANNGLVWSPRLTNVETGLALKAPILNPNFSGVPTAPTAVRSSNTQQIANTAYVNDLVKFSVNQVMTWVQERMPEQIITAWAGSVESIPTNWQLCNGEQGSPDLRNKFIMGAGKQTGTAFCINETGGSATATFNTTNLTTSSVAVDVNIETTPVALTKDQIPNHSHFNNLTMVYYGGNTLPLITGAGGGKGGSSGTTVGFLTPVNETSVGLSQPHSHVTFGKTQAHTHVVNLPSNVVEILPPYYVLAYIILKPTTYTFTIS